MTKLELLKEYNERECHNLLCCSENYLMTKPRAGYENEHTKCLERVKLLKEMIRIETAEDEHDRQCVCTLPTVHVMVSSIVLKPEQFRKLSRRIREAGIPKEIQLDLP